MSEPNSTEIPLTLSTEDEEIAEEWISDIVKAIGKHSKELGDLADRLVTRWNDFSTAREDTGQKG